MAKSFTHDAKLVVTYIGRFLIHTTSTVILFAICVGASKATCLIRHWVPFDGYIHGLIFKLLELYFLMLGALNAAAYVSVQTLILIGDIIETVVAGVKEQPSVAGAQAALTKAEATPAKEEAAPTKEEVVPTEAEVASTETEQPLVPIKVKDINTKAKPRQVEHINGESSENKAETDKS